MKNVADYSVGPDASLREVIETIDSGKAQVALVLDAEKKLLGLITDGDVRRAVLRGDSLSSSAKNLMNSHFCFLSDRASEQDALDLMRQKTLHQIPVLDDAGRVLRLFLLEDLIKKKNFKNSVVIMAGGEGKRLGALTKNCPKPMLLVESMPILEHIILRAISDGFVNFVISVNYLADKIITSPKKGGLKFPYLQGLYNSVSFLTFIFGNSVFKTIFRM